MNINTTKSTEKCNSAFSFQLDNTSETDDDTTTCDCLNDHDVFTRIIRDEYESHWYYEDERAKNDNTNTIEYKIDNGSSQTHFQQNNSIEKDEKSEQKVSFTWFAEQFELMEKNEVQITSIDKINGRIYVRPVSLNSNYLKFLKEIPYHFPAVNKFKRFDIGDYVYFIYDGYRGRIIGTGDSLIYTVFLLDFGSTIICQHNSLLPCNEWFFTKAPFCQRIMLKDVSDDIVAKKMESEENFKSLFGRSFNWKTFECEVKRRDESYCVVELFDINSRKSLSAEILALPCPQSVCALRQYIDDIRYAPYSAENMYEITHIVSPTEFFVCETRSLQELRLASTFYAINEPVEEVKKAEPNEILIAYCSEHRVFGRAACLDISERTHKVYFIDYGIEKSVDKLYRMPRTMAKISLSAFKCYISDDGQIVSSRLPELMEKFMIFTAGNCFKLKVLKYDEIKRGYLIRDAYWNDKSLLAFLIRNTADMDNEHETLQENNLLHIKGILAKTISSKRNLIRTLVHQLKDERKAIKQLQRYERLMQKKLT